MPALILCVGRVLLYLRGRIQMRAVDLTCPLPAVPIRCREVRPMLTPIVFLIPYFVGANRIQNPTICASVNHPFISDLLPACSVFAGNCQER